MRYLTNCTYPHSVLILYHIILFLFKIFY
ncbi:hypothetical protein ACQ27_gp262 [Klebsiella phage K64-1]|nr:hypothetical protein ACQ27_gp262 [Klebsiella phage K64-1]